MNVTSKIPLIAKIVLPIVAILSLWLLLDHNEITNNTDALGPAATPTRSIDYSVSGFTLTIMDDSGLPSRIIKGESMIHYPDSDSTEMLNPVTYFIDQQRDTWVISSHKGQTQGKAEEMLLTGNVIITRNDNNETEFRTEQLFLDSLHSIAYTDLAVTMKSLYGETTSIGLHAALKDKTINLHSRVRGHYNAPSN